MIILILVLSGGVGYEKFIDTIKKTWGSEKYEEIKILYYYGDSDELKIDRNNVYLPVPERHNMMGPRTLEMFDYVLNYYEFDYIFRVNAGSYVRQDNLIKFIKDKPKEKFYCGVIGNYRNIKYASGSGYFLSKDLVQLLVDNKFKIVTRFKDKMPVVDDVAVGKMIGELSDVKICESATRCNIKDDKITFDNAKNDNDIYHYRIKSDFNRNDDIEKIYRLYEKYKR